MLNFRSILLMFGKTSASSAKTQETVDVQLRCGLLPQPAVSRKVRKACFACRLHQGNKTCACSASCHSYWQSLRGVGRLTLLAGQGEVPDGFWLDLLQDIPDRESCRSHRKSNIPRSLDQSSSVLYEWSQYQDSVRTVSTVTNHNTSVTSRLELRSICNW